MGTEHLGKCTEFCLFNQQCYALQTICGHWCHSKLTLHDDQPGWLGTASDVLWWKTAVLPSAGGRRLQRAWRKNIMWRKKQSTTDVPPGQHHSVPATSRQRGTQARAQMGFVCIQWNYFCIQRGFQLLWGRWKGLLAVLKCLVLPVFGSMRGARTKYATVQCKLPGKN